MNQVPTRRLDVYYEQLQKGFAIVDAPDFAKLVTPNGNGSAPIHRWFRMKESYSCELVDRVLLDTGLAGRKSLTVCDPFTGAGTTAVSIASRVAAGRATSASILGAEVNPFLHLVATAKLGAIRSPYPNFIHLAARIAGKVTRRQVEPAPPPSLSTFHRRDFFGEAELEELLRLKAAIDLVAADGDPSGADLAKVCLGVAIEASSTLRRDGRALRHEPRRVPTRPLISFLDKAEQITEDMPRTGADVIGSIDCEDARSPSWIGEREAQVDLFLFSPPYPNNIDYTEVYKLEAWLLGLISNANAFSSQRRRTIRSHASLDFGSEPTETMPMRSAVDDLIAPVLQAVPSAGRYAKGRIRTIRGYVYDMYQSILNLSSISAPGADLVYVVGNSLHGGAGEQPIPIASDVLIASLVEMAGFKVDRICVARMPQRRRTTSDFVRESVVYARRSTAAVRA